LLITQYFSLNVFNIAQTKRSRAEMILASYLCLVISIKETTTSGRRGRPALFLLHFDLRFLARNLGYIRAIYQFLQSCEKGTWRHRFHENFEIVASTTCLFEENGG